MLPERRSHVRHKVQGPLFASFDGVTGGMILDLSEQGMSMKTVVPVETDQQVRLRVGLPDYDVLETTGYVAWADALGRAGVRFSELPPEARQRLDQWLAANDQAPNRRAPKITLDRVVGPGRAVTSGGNGAANTPSISLEAGSLEAGGDGRGAWPEVSNTVQYEFHSLGSDLNNALRIISERALTLLRGAGAAIALSDLGSRMPRGMLCRASVGTGGPPLGTHVDVNAGFTGECVRTGKALRCDNAETDSRVAPEVCRRLGIRSMVAAPIRYERQVIGLVEVFSPHSFAFDEGDLAILERLAQTALFTANQHFYSNDLGHLP